MIWVNIDKLMRTMTIHSDTQCTYVKNKEETIYRGVGELKRDGGWLHFSNLREAKEFYLSKYDRFKLVEHCMDNTREDVHIAEKEDHNVKELSDDSVPINSATDHYHRIVGLSTKKVNPSTLPIGIRMFYYFIISILSIGAIILVFTFIFKD